MALENLAVWIENVGRELDRLLNGFELEAGYPPGINEIRLVSHELVPDVAGLPDQVQQFFSVVDQVELPDVWNGYFIGPASDVVSRYRQDKLSRMTVEGGYHRVFAVGSDGGGAYFVVDMDDAGCLVRVQDAMVQDGVLRGSPTVLGADFDEFLDLLLANVVSVNNGVDPAF